MKLVVDSWAWLALTEDEKTSKKVLDLIENKENEIFTTTLSAFEVIYRLEEKLSNRGKALEFFESMKLKSKIIEIDENLAIIASEVRKKEKLAAMDSFVYATAIKLNAHILTGDNDFKGKTRVIML